MSATRERPASTALPRGRRSVLRIGGFAVRVDARSALVAGVLLLVLIAVAVASLALGDYPIPVRGVVAALLGHGDGVASTIVLEWRLPRVLAAVLFGAALAVSGAIFQSITRNPLGSPDVIGFTTGSYSGALIVLLVLGSGSALIVAVGAVSGGLVTALAVYLLAYRRGVEGFRLVVVGIGVSALLTSLNTFLLLRAQREVALSASIWGSGSLSDIEPGQVRVAGLLLAALLVCALPLARPLRQLELGDDSARATGVSAERMRLLALVVGVALTAVVTSVSGPIAFVALAAPQIASRVLGRRPLPLATSALVGALLLLAADQLAQHAVPGTVFPVGTVTVCVGGAYLVWLLAREGRRRL